MTTYLDILNRQLPIDEGVRYKPYKDTMGILSIGVGRNLDQVGIRPDEMALMLRNDIADAEKIARRLVPVFDQLSEERKAVIVNMAFNLGPRLGSFVNTLAAINRRDFKDAADGMRASLWAKQVGARAERLAVIMEGG